MAERGPTADAIAGWPATDATRWTADASAALPLSTAFVVCATARLTGANAAGIIARRRLAPSNPPMRHAARRRPVCETGRAIGASVWLI